MIIRIVKMGFHPENVPAFLENFHKFRDHIRGSAGNEYLELLQDVNDPSIFFTYSHWQKAEDLKNYRKSELFSEVWDFTKKLFNAKPEAWSLEKH